LSPGVAAWQHHAARQQQQTLDYPSHQYQKVVVVGSVNERHLTSYNVGTATVHHHHHQSVRAGAAGADGGYVGLHASSAPTVSHMDMVRPPHENPELAGYQSPSPNASPGGGPER
jgi:hypothetical protein